MKVCMLTTSYPSYEGHHRTPFIYFLSQALAKKVELDVVCPYFKDSKDNFNRFKYWIPNLQTLTERGGIPSEIRRSWYSRIQFIPFVLSYALKAFIVGRKADVIHANWILSGAAALPLKWILGKKIILNERGSSLNMLKRNSVGKFFIKFVVSRMDYVVANNNHQIETLKEFKVPKKVIKNGVKINYRKVKKTGNKLLFVGNLVEEKGVLDLLEVIPKLKCECYFVGDGILRKKLEKSFSHVLGPLRFDEVSKYYNSADIFVFPSWMEGRPNVLIEAMGYGLPVVAYDIPGVNEVIENGYNGILVELKNISDFTKAVEKLMNNKGLYRKMSENARKWFKENSSTWDEAATEFIKVYQEVL